jgi:hypothetical protein
MDQRRTPPSFSAAAGTRSAPSVPRRRHPADDLELAVRDAEELARDFRAGVRSHDHYHQLEERAQTIAAAIVAPFRGPAKARPVNAPLHQEPGRCIW